MKNNNLLRKVSVSGILTIFILTGYVGMINTDWIIENVKAFPSSPFHDQFISEGGIELEIGNFSNDALYDIASILFSRSKTTNSLYFRGIGLYLQKVDNTFPSDPDPGDGETDVNIGTNLSWTGGDPNPGDTVTYDVYFDTVSPPSQVVWGQTETSYDPGTFEYSTTYYWKIVAKDQLAATTEGPIWSFTTEEENLPPDLPYNPYPENDSIDVEILPTLQVTVDDPDGDELDVYWFSNCTDEWTLFDTNYSVDTSGGPVNVSQINDNFDKYGTTYWWSVNVTDTFAWANATFYFTTEEDTMLPSIEFIPPTPDNGTIQSEDYIEVNISASDESDLYTFVDFNSDLGFWMRMDDVYGSTVVDLSSYGNNGTAVNETHQVENGRYGKGFDFDGDGDYIEIPETSGLDFAPGSFTISAWIKPRNVSNGWITILEHGRLLDNWFGIWIDGSSSKFHFRVGGNRTNSNETLLVDRWYHLVGVYNASTHETVQYIDGEFDSSEVIIPGTYWDEPANQSVTIGVRGSMDGEYFDGIIDEILIFDRILNDEEIKALYSIKTLNQHEYYSKAYGNWLGQIAGNFLGRETEGDYISSPNPAESIYYSPYSSYITGTGNEHDYKNLSVNSQTDDDTSMEWVDLWMLENYGLDITYEEVNSSWQAHMTSGIFFANKYAYMLMTGDAEPQSGPCDSFYECTPTGLECPGCCGCIPPYSGMEGYNPYFDYIDAQIESEVFGVLSPGMIKSAEKWGDWFARVTNDGYAVDFAKFYSMMYAEAIFEDNITRIIETVTAKYPSDSKVVSVVENVTGWYYTYSDWRDTCSQIHSKYYTDEYLSEANGRSAWWIHSTHNFAATLMSLLYGNGDFDKVIQIAALAGWDNDCTAATVGGLMGTMLGAENIPHKWRYPIRDFYENTNRNPAVLGDDTITNIANRTINLGALFIQENGGNSFERGGVTFYEIPTENYGSAYHKFTDLPDGTYRFTGYTVDGAGNQNETEEREVTIQINNPPNKSITPSGPTLVPAGYEQVYNTSTTDPENHQIFYMWDWGDGNITGWIGPYPSGSVAYANHTWPDLGTYNVTVKAKDDPNGDGSPVDGLESPWSDPLMVQVVISGDLDGDGDVDLSDLAQLLAHYGTQSGATYEQGDINGDGDVDLSDLAALLANYGFRS